ncbi:hypothetical protein EON81_03260 [bacterium]|nr:MAG: hypothetical protein EON81_03260 [bacterium]
MKRLYIAAGVMVAAGCGGGSAPGGGNSPPGETVNEFGPIQTRGQVTGSPIVQNLPNISTVALAGVLTDATYRPQGTPDNETGILTSGPLGSLQVVLENGEKIATFKPTYPVPNDAPLYPSWSLDGQKIYYRLSGGVYSTTLANPTVATPVITAVDMFFYTLSPDNLKIAYTRTPPGEVDREVYVRAVAGGATTRVTNNDIDDLGTVWIDNERLAVRREGPDVPNQGTQVVTIANGTFTNYVPFKSFVAPFGRSGDGAYFLNAASGDPAFGVSLSERFNTSDFAVKNYLAPEFTSFGPASTSPDGTRWVFFNSQGLFTTELFPKTATVIAPAGPVGMAGASWQPALGNTKFVGASGKLGSSSAGIIATNRTGGSRNGLASFVAWDATTRSTSTVSDDGAGSDAGATSYVVEADNLTSLKYANRPLFMTTATVGTGTANGAIVTVSASDGTVRSIVVYKETRGAKPVIRKEGEGKVIEGSVIGVWDAYGKDLAPQGASRVSLDKRGNPTLG